MEILALFHDLSFSSRSMFAEMTLKIASDDSFGKKEAMLKASRDAGSVLWSFVALSVSLSTWFRDPDLSMIFRKAGLYKSQSFPFIKKKGFHFSL